MNKVWIPLLAVYLAAAGVAPAQGIQPPILPNRLTLEVSEDPSRPLARAILRLALPPEPVGREGMAGFALDTLERCAAGSHSRASFNRALDRDGLILRRTVEPGRVTWELTGAPQALDAGLALLADQILRPQVDGTAVERVRLRFAHALRSTTPGARALQRARAGLGAPGGTPMEEGFLSQVGQVEVEAYLRDLLRPDRAILRLEGAVVAGQARAAAFHHFGAWPLPQSPLPPPAPGPVSRICMVQGGAHYAWLGLDLGDAPPAVHELLALAAPRVLGSGSMLEVLPGGLAMHSTQDGPVAQLARLQARVDALAVQGFDAEAFDEARRRHAALQTARILHPTDRARAAVDPAETARAVAAMDRAVFNAELRRLLGPSRRRAVLTGVGASAAADPTLLAFGQPDIWDADRAAFVKR